MKSLPPLVIIMLVAITASWGVSSNVAKLLLAEIGPGMQALIRGVLSTLFVTLVMRARGERIIGRDGTLGPGLLVGTLFAVEFCFIYMGLTLTTASRSIIFVCTMPLWAALGSALFLKADRPSGLQALGLVAAFTGICIAFADGLINPGSGQSLAGDLMSIVAGLLWALTNLAIRGTKLRTAPSLRTLWFQLAMSIPVATGLIWITGERFPAHVSPAALGMIAYQAFWVAGVTYIVWFELMTRYPAPVLSGFTVLSPVLGVLSSNLILGEPMTPHLMASLTFVAAGLFLTSRMPKPPATITKSLGHEKAREA